MNIKPNRRTHQWPGHRPHQIAILCGEPNDDPREPSLLFPSGRRLHLHVPSLAPWIDSRETLEEADLN